MSKHLPEPFQSWFSQQGWSPRPHQFAMLQAAEDSVSALLIAPTGGGKTLAGFLPSLIELADGSCEGLHTLYVSPLKALSANIAESLSRPIMEMRLPVRVEVRSGDTSGARRKRQQKNPPHILLTTPESLALLLSYPDAATYFSTLKVLIIDEVHAMAGTKRGDQLVLCASRLRVFAPALRINGLSATVAHPSAMAAWVSPTGQSADIRLVKAEDGVRPDVHVLLPDQRGYLPWAGRTGLGSATAILAEIARARLTIVFVNSRAQAELLFQALWKDNADNLPIGLHHGSLDAARRSRVEEAMARGDLRAVVATSSLDLGLDWGAVDQIIQVGAPKQISRLTQRIGRANHRMDEPSRALLAPANRFEVLECEAAKEAVLHHELDGEPPRAGALDVLAQHVLVTACSGPFFPDTLYAEVRQTAPYSQLSRADFDEIIRFVEDGGYALQAYERHQRLFRDSLGKLWVRNEQIIRQCRMNIGTIVDTPMLRVKSRRGKPYGEIDEYFASTLVPGDTFLLGGELLEFLGLHDTTVQAARGRGKDPRVPVYGGNQLSISPGLARHVREILHTPSAWEVLPKPVQDWLSLQASRSELPGPENFLVETFPHRGLYYIVAYPFEGRNAHQTLGLLLTKRLEETGKGPLGFVANDYMVACWCVHPTGAMTEMFSRDLLGGNLTDWLAESAMLRRTFRDVAIIAGLVERNYPGREKNRRQMTISSDLLYDVLRKYDPDHILLRATRLQAEEGLTDLGRLSAMLDRIQGHIEHVTLSHVSPLAVPVLLEQGREKIKGGEGEDYLLAEADKLYALAGKA
ncbi:ligase-associated DNA damage response DEXH box helicase [Gluconobacter japonicus]|uniref:ligase-associated DNA damage response DEXH box helicase n=2 Tax=Gluconobacter TaxID=441 RepID=UPI001B8BE8CF|nr:MULTISPECIES: ligase-associated DNA damage response DEXH box helicase [Gluconobacter]MBS1051346.1 ligase-associated DNA damage response DEXH box helicase [Gluconobacter japonicus]